MICVRVYFSIPALSDCIDIDMHAVPLRVLVSEKRGHFFGCRMRTDLLSSCGWRTPSFPSHRLASESSIKVGCSADFKSCYDDRCLFPHHGIAWETSVRMKLTLPDSKREKDVCVKSIPPNTPDAPQQLINTFLKRSRAVFYSEVRTTEGMKRRDRSRKTPQSKQFYHSFVHYSPAGSEFQSQGSLRDADGLLSKIPKTRSTFFSFWVLPQNIYYI